MAARGFKTTYSKFPYISISDKVLFVAEGPKLKSKAFSDIKETVENISAHLKDDVYFCCGTYLKLEDNTFKVVDKPDYVVEFKNSTNEDIVLVYDDKCYMGSFGQKKATTNYTLISSINTVVAALGLTKGVSKNNYVKAFDDKLLFYKHNGEIKCEADPEKFESKIKSFDPVKQTGSRRIEAVIKPSMPRPAMIIPEPTFVTQTRTPIKPPTSNSNSALITYCREMQRLEQTYCKERIAMYENLIRSLGELEMH